MTEAATTRAQTLRPENFIWGGLALAFGLGVVSAVLFSVDTGLGWTALAISVLASNIVIGIGVIAKGVEIGIRVADRT